MNPVMFWLAASAGAMVGTLYDPSVWAMLLLCMMAGWFRLNFFVPIIIAFLASCLVVAVNWSWWESIGVSLDAGRVLRVFLPRLGWALLAYGVGRLVAWVIRKQPA